MPIRVAFDATPLPAQRLGAAGYITGVLQAMSAFDVDLHVLANARDADELANALPRATLHPITVRSRPLRLAWAHLALPRLAKKIAPDVFHGPHYTLPPGLPKASAVTFHDPTFFTHPQFHERAKVQYFTRAARSGIARATRAIAVSEYARRGAIEHAGAEPDRTDVVLHGVDHSRYTPGEPDGVEPYILFVGALEPRKSVPTLIRAYGELVDAGLEHGLVLCGKPAWGTDAIDETIAGLNKARVERTGYVSEADKIAYYRKASVFVYPSIAEGFGLPVLEAMACGVPVVTTTGSAPEEIAAGAALLVPPENPVALREAIECVLTDGELAAKLRARGIERAREFTWERAAEQTHAVWLRAADQAR